MTLLDRLKYLTIVATLVLKAAKNLNVAFVARYLKLEGIKLIMRTSTPEIFHTNVVYASKRFLAGIHCDITSAELIHRTNAQYARRISLKNVDSMSTQEKHTGRTPMSEGIFYANDVI